MSEQLSSSIDRVLNQSLLNFKDQMSIYSTHPWSVENGHGYNDVEQFALRDGPITHGRNHVATRPANAMEPRRNAEREIDINCHPSIQCHYEDPRNDLPGPPGIVHMGAEYACPPGRPAPSILIENGFLDDFHRDNRSFTDIDRCRTEPGYYKGQPRLYGPPEGRPFHGEGYHLPFEIDAPDGPRYDFRYSPGGPRGLLPHPSEDRNQGLRTRGYDSYSSSPGSSWSPSDNNGSPNAYPPPLPSRLRHLESYPPDARRQFCMDRPPYGNHPPHLNSRNPIDGQWRPEQPRRHPRPHQDDDGYFFPRRVDFVGPPPYPSHLRDPRLNRGGPTSSHGPSSPLPHNQVHCATSNSRSSSCRRTRIDQIYSEHCYFKTGDPCETMTNSSSETCQAVAPQQEPQVHVEGLRPDMLSPVPHVIAIIMNKPLSQNSRPEVLEKECESVEPRDGVPMVQNLQQSFSSVIAGGGTGTNVVSEETSVKPDSSSVALSSVVETSSANYSSSVNTKENLSCSSEESSRRREAEMASDQTLQKQSSALDSPSSPTSSLISSFDMSLDSEPESSDNSDEEEKDSVQIDEDILKLVPTSSVSTRKPSKTNIQPEMEAEPTKVGQTNSRVLRSRILPLPTTSVVHPTPKHPVAVLDDKLPSPRLPLSRDGAHASVIHAAKFEDGHNMQPRTRRSRRLATSQDAVVENKGDEVASPTVGMSTDSMESDEDAGEPTDHEDPLLRASAEVKEPVAQELTREEKMHRRLVIARAAKAAKEKRRGRKSLFGYSAKKTLSKKKSDVSDEASPQCQKRNTVDFVPEILPTKSRTETATLHRRKQMEREIEEHERERLETARPGEDERLLSPSTVIVEPPDSSQGDDMSTGSVSDSLTTASSQSADTTPKGSLLDEFPSDMALRCKRIASVRSSSGDTPLHKVCRTGKYDMARYLLLVEKYPVNVQDYAGWTPLHEACSNSNLLVAKLLLQHGADVNISASDGTRPIHDAIEVGAFDLVKLLIQNGADPLAEQGEKTPAEFALEMDEPEIHDYLQSIVEERKAQQSKLVSASNQPVVSQAQSRKLKKKEPNEWEGDELMMPIDGYSKDDPKFGVELDHPLFYVSPIVEMSEVPFLPDVYNLEVVSGRIPRRHNFYLLSDVLKALKITESELRKRCHGIRAVELTVDQVISRLRNRFVFGDSLPHGLRNLPSETKVKLVPLCARLRNLFDIEVANMDD